MKRGIAAVFLLLSAFCHSGVQITARSDSPGLVTIGYSATADAGIRGIALSVTLLNWATAVYSDIVSIDPVFNVFIDYAYDHSDYQLGQGHPFANLNQPGALETPASTFSICMGHLDGQGGMSPAPAIVENLITFKIHGGTRGYSHVIIEGDAFRGSIVGDNVGQVIYPEPLYVITPEPATLAILAVGGLFLRKRG